MNKKRGVLIVTESDAQMIKTRHWMVSRDITYRTYYLPITSDEKKPIIMAEMTLTDKLLYRLTFGLKTEKVTAYM